MFSDGHKVCFFNKCLRESDQLRFFDYDVFLIWVLFIFDMSNSSFDQNNTEYLDQEVGGCQRS